MNLFIGLILGLATLTTAQATVTTPTSCETSLISRSYLTTPKRAGLGKIAREMGVQFLMIRVRNEHFKQLVSAAGQNGEIKIAANWGWIKGINPNETGHSFEHSMIPLMTRDQGRWAHSLIGDGSDFISMGVRYKNADQWKVGLIFPVEILDYFDFEIGSAFASAFGSNWFKSNSGTEAEFRRALELEYPDQYPDSKSAYVYGAGFSFTEEIPVHLVELVWMPAPMIKSFVPGDHSKYPGLGSPLVPPAGKAFEMRISWQTPGIGRGWTDVIPPHENTTEFFDASQSLGTWFNTVPDWQIVRTQLALQPKRGRPFLPPPSREALPR